MKKNLLIATVALTLAITGCASQPATDPGNSSELESLKAQVHELENENSDLKSQVAKLEQNAETTAEETKAAQKGTPVSVGDVITTDNMEIKINKVELSYDVLPDDTSGFYTHYEADPGNVFLHIDADVKNLGKQNLPCDKLMSATADYNDGYTYYGEAVPEDSTSGFTYANITAIKPLETLGVRFLFKCPQEVDESENPLFVVLEPTGTKDSYVLTVR